MGILYFTMGCGAIKEQVATEQMGRRTMLTKNLIRQLCTILTNSHAKLGYFGDRNFDGPILINICREIEVVHESGEFSLGSIGENFGFRSGYYEGFNFDREGSDDYDASEEDIANLKDDLYDRIFNYDELYLEEYCEENGLDLKEEQDKIYKETCDYIDKVVGEIDDLYHKIGETFFDEYRVSARFSNGETWYEKTA